VAWTFNKDIGLSSFLIKVSQSFFHHMRILRGCKSLNRHSRSSFASRTTHANPSVASAEEGSENVSASMGATPGLQEQT